MSTYQFQLHLNSEIFYGQIRNWRDFFPTIRINEKYRTRLPVFSFEEISFTKAAKTYIDIQRELYGPLANITFELKLWNDNAWIDFIAGRLAMDRYNKAEIETRVGVDPDSFVMRWLNNDELPLELTTLTDIKGNTITAFASELTSVPLDTQVLDRIYEGITSESFFTYDNDSVVASPVNVYLQLGCDGSNINELPEEAFNIPSQFMIPGTGLDEIQHFVELSDDGDDYEIKIDYNITYEGDITNVNTSGSITLNISLIRAKYDHETDSWTTTTLATDTANSGGDLNLTGTFTGSATVNYTGDRDPDDSSKFDKVRLYIRFNLSGGSYDLYYTADVDQLDITVSKKDTYPDTDCNGMLIYEAALRMLQKLTGRNDPLRSTLLGRTDSEVHTYAADGPASLMLYTNGRHVRQFPVSDFPLKGEFYELFRALNADWNIGVGIIEEAGIQYIAIEEISYFWDNSKVVFSITDPEGVLEQTALDYIFNKLEFGNSKYETEENGTLGSAHTPRTYTTGLGDVVNSSYDFTQPAITSGPLIELLRRDPYQDGSEKDNQHDNAIVLIRLVRDGGGYRREKGSDFTTVNNISNPDSQYNLSITPRRALNRHLNWIKGGGFQGATELDPADKPRILFTSGDGNVKLETLKTGDPGSFTENSEALYLTEGDDPLFLPNLVRFNYPITKEQMINLVADPNQVIQVTSKGRTFKAFILVSEVEDFESKEANFRLLEAYE